MNTTIRGELVSLGTPMGETQPRALVHCTREQIQSVQRLCVLAPVIVVAEAELMNTLGELQRRLEYLATQLTELDRITTAGENRVHDEIAKLKHQLELCAHDVRFLKNEP